MASEKIMNFVEEIKKLSVLEMLVDAIRKNLNPQQLKLALSEEKQRRSRLLMYIML